MLDIIENIRCYTHTEAHPNVGGEHILENKLSLQKRMENIDLHFVYSNLTVTTYRLHITFHAAGGFLSAV